LNSSPERHHQLAPQGLQEDALASLQRAVQLAPEDARNHYNLGTALARRGRLQEALACFQRAVELRPRHAGTHNNVGETLRRLGRLDEAIAWLRQAIQLRPQSAEAHNNLGIALFQQSHVTEAVACYRSALHLRPAYPDALNNLGNALRDQGRLEEAEAQLRQAIKLQVDLAEAHNDLGLVLRDRERLEEARACFEEALRLKPTYADAHCNLGALRQDLGDLEGAAGCFREALRHEARHAGALAGLAMLLRGKLDDPALSQLQERLADPLLSADQRTGLGFALAHVLDGRRQYLEAAAHLEQANAQERDRWRRRRRQYHPADNARFVDQLKQTFTSQFFERIKGWGSDSRRPVFIFGMPRSGTTLVEQILASHSQVHGGGELPFGHDNFDALAALAGVASAPLPLRHEQALGALEHIDHAGIHRLAGQHLGWLERVNSSAARVTSKMPENWLYLGLLATLFPRAAFIHCRRDPRDVALSCWMTHFQHLNWTCDPEHLASRFHDHRRLMAHWCACLPVPLLEIDYEETVANPEKVARCLVSVIGLDWEPACLEFHRSTRPVRTASAVQVRQPLYRSSVGRWRNYAAVLGPLFHRVESACRA
jgi:tetratricopeptide (TPR) repeat protein